MESETVPILRERIGRIVAGIQRDAAGMHEAAAHARDQGLADRALFGQEKAARLHRDVSEWLDWLADDVFMREWCDNINHGRLEQDRYQSKQRIVKVGDESAVVFYVDGLRAREVF